ncbi:hypothetical protein EV651_115176 [Kribbella sp. VKM Ac-2571]|uniref:hypothetical protein n=1 Tax=Kribbella sp. VKM Ac-2571 TaxID=2512222 RepID=UPI00105FBC82|nr:hypothetical protein [Kribbella sp. VKM Ac-2571]TDO55212.1 hypothetical protein EV651_115176 [Kribbella sp. VKM Ac-2571]
MDRGLLNSLSEAERLLVAETERDVLKGLDEDELLELHQRVRRARTKYVKNYRRAAGAAVAEVGSRGVSYPRNQRDRDKAELFESVLARVSRQVATAASRASSELRSERIEAARSARARVEVAPVRGAGRAASVRDTDAAVAPAGSRRPRATKTTGGLKKDASTRAAGARRQAKRDTR